MESKIDELKPEKADRPTFERMPQTVALLAELRRLRPGESITFEELTRRLGFDPAPDRGRLYRCRELIARDGGGVIDPCVVDDHPGVRRLTDEEAIHVASERYRRKARNAGERGIRSLVSVEYEKLKDTDKVEHNVRLSMLGAMRLVISPKARRTLEGVVAGSGAALDTPDVLRLFEKVK